MPLSCSTGWPAHPTTFGDKNDTVWIWHRLYLHAQPPRSGLAHEVPQGFRRRKHLASYAKSALPKSLVILSVVWRAFYAKRSRRTCGSGCGLCRQLWDTSLEGNQYNRPGTEGMTLPCSPGPESHRLSGFLLCRNYSGAVMPRSCSTFGLASSTASRLWQAAQSWVIDVPSFAEWSPSWQRKQPG